MGAMLPLCVDLDLSAQKDSDQMCICQAISNRGPRRVETKPLTPVSCRPSPSETDIQFPCQTEKPVPENYLTYSLLYSYRMPQADTPGYIGTIRCKHLETELWQTGVAREIVAANPSLEASTTTAADHSWNRGEIG